MNEIVVGADVIEMQIAEWEQGAFILSKTPRESLEFHLLTQLI